LNTANKKLAFCESPFSLSHAALLHCDRQTVNVPQHQSQSVQHDTTQQTVMKNKQ